MLDREEQRNVGMPHCYAKSLLLMRVALLSSEASMMLHPWSNKLSPSESALCTRAQNSSGIQIMIQYYGRAGQCLL